MPSEPMNRARALIIRTRPQDYVAARVSEAASYLSGRSDATEEDRRLASEAIEWLRSKRNEKPAPKTEQVSEPKPPPAKQKRKSR